MYKIVASIFVLFQVVTCQTIGNIYNVAAYNNGITPVIAEVALANSLAANAYNPAVNAYNPAVNAYNPAVNAYNPAVNAYNPAVNAYAYEIPQAPCSIPGINYGLGVAELGASRGPGLRVSSTSPISPSGMTVESENIVMEGPLSVSGQLPFLGVVSMEGPLPAAGLGSVAYNCGSGNVGIVTEGPETVAANLPGLPGPHAPLQARVAF
ncbi:chorion class CB protein PC404-like [Aricia agestis]|uniref:chorion class CB protein PC404-like n=1 Tax=Aricia agestis TaxID=91739 RepID=UPI001C205579|nr:chorion class CB protein PC404-like [Aricia agestis]